ncbi:hypothetical protein HSX37_01925|uniref:Uncharacterized protein n=1 Tax=Dendrosporobacter quercicolus TaxID=146817 RepID=A0A1G9LSC0_9FIRM|nr:hypothetical protein [Dendrosporobacter quercicolus]NSL46814.1 hypothetical protein [Dendrosporobacter quercicolus DSM 1736]SDL64880.1 hypothetical protein SAMN04488502_101453 [Dendrosporobacter quercicolus]
MDQSRTARRQKQHYSLYRKTFGAAAAVLTCAGLGLIWYFNYKLTVTLAAVIIFFGILGLRPACRQYLPGLTSSNAAVRLLAVFLYLIIVFALISKVKRTMY